MIFALQQWIYLDAYAICLEKKQRKKKTKSNHRHMRRYHLIFVKC